MKKLIFSALIFLGIFGHAENLKTRAKREGWSFKFKENHRVYHKGLKKKVILSSERKVFVGRNIQIPNSLDLRPLISPIRDQGECGSCWAHSLTATLEDGYLIAGRSTSGLSPQYLVDCASNANGCEGGYFDAALYLVFPKGSPTNSSYPYTGQEGQCQNKPAVADIVSYHLLGGESGPSTEDIEAYMAKYNRPVSITVAAGAGAWQNYVSGIYNGCTQGPVDHMINIVGWDNEGAKFDKRGNLPHGKGIWILKNSWGNSWGEQGWMRTKMTDSRGRRCNNVGEEAAFFDYNFTQKTEKEEPEYDSNYLYGGLAIIFSAALLSFILL